MFNLCQMVQSKMPLHCRVAEKTFYSFFLAIAGETINTSNWQVLAGF